MYSDTITLFNQYETADGTVLWYPTIIKGVDLNADKAAIIAQYGEQTQDNAKLHIKYTRDADGNIFIANKMFLPPFSWKNQVNDRLPHSITFADGVSFSFFIVGEWGDGTVVNETEDYPRTGFYAYMRDRYDYVFAVTSSAQYSVIPHFEIMAK